MSPESTVSPEHASSPPPINAEAVAVDALLEAVKAADLNDAAWGPAANDVDDGVPLFMKLLLRDTEMGAIFSEFSQPVAAAPVPGSSRNKTLASCVQPSRVTVGRAGAMVVEFPKDSGGSGDGGWWLVLSTQPGAADLFEATVSVYLSDAQDLKLLAAHPLPNATFLAVDVTKAMLELGGSWPRLVVDVTSPRTAAGAASAATTLEVAGWERGPLLVRALDWGEDATSQGAARSDIHRDGGEQDAADGDAFCHLESWTVSLEDLGWPFIVAPLTFNINFCAGRCPPSALGEKRYNASMNAIARTYIKLHRAAKASAGTSADDGANIPAAQCVPIRFKPIALLMRQNDGSIDLFTSYDLSADRCGCR
ncbi:BMP15-like [Frankliniella occidentalis]|nr:BMP15-like [Frankliniella occidentalis]